MRFRLAHKLVTFLLPGVAVVTLATSEQISPLRLLLLLFAFVLAWYADPGTRVGLILARASHFIALLTVVFLGVAVFQVVHSFPEVNLVPFLDFVFFLLAAKLCQRRQSRDHLQIFVLSLLIMLAAAWMATSLVFLLGFGFFVLLATWGLILFHLRNEIESNYLVRHNNEFLAEQITADRVLNSRRVVGANFFFGTGAMALLVFVGAAVVFALIPRVGLGFILGGVRRQGAIAGFSDEVKLGRRGTISTANQTVVLRARIPAIENIANDTLRDRAIAGLYWRGTVYDAYAKGEWLRSRQEKNRSLVMPTVSRMTYGKSYLLADPYETRPHVSHKTALLHSTLQHIEIVGMANPVAFALDRPVAIEISPPRGSFFALDIEPRFGGEIGLRPFRVNPSNPFDRRHPIPEFFGGEYLAYSRPSDDLAQKVEFASEAQLGAKLLETYLLLPTDLSPRVRELAKRLIHGKNSPETKIAAIVEWLQRTHDYSTNLGRNDHIVDPLEDFIFEQFSGHCEYFASAAAILLRLGGVPTRYVNGFLGGEWNTLQHMVTVRENRAHAWVEAYAGKRGWIRVDATPPQIYSTRMGRFRQLLDASELLFSRWVLEYNAGQQLRLAENLGRQFGFTGRTSGVRKPFSPMSRRQAALVALFIVALLAVWKTRHLLWRILRPRAQGVRGFSRDNPGIIRLYRATLRRLHSAGLPRGPSETPHEYLQRLCACGIEGAQVFAELTRCYTEARYGDRHTPPEILGRLQAEAPTIHKAA